MTTVDETLAPPCRIGEHGYCHGPGEVRIRGSVAPVMTLRCDCPCHQARSDPRPH